MHYCPQEDGPIEPIVRDFASCLLGEEDWRWQERLALHSEELERWSSLSAGERRRWRLGAALASPAQTLLLDEPSNHLDASGRALLIAAMREWRGTGLVVSHDRELLEAVCRSTVELRRGGARCSPGPYSAARAAWAAEEQARREAADRASEQARRARRALGEARRTSASAERERSAGRRMKTIHDTNASGMMANRRAERASAGASQGVRLARREAEEAARLAAELSPGRKDPGRSLHLGYEPPPMERLLGLDGEALRVGERVLLPAVHLELRRGDRVHLAGDNGSGKSTLVRALLASSRLPADRVLWLPQELEPERVARELEVLHGLDPQARGRVLQLVAALGLDPERLLQTSHPSPGEARKLALALGMGRRAWLLVLDEPTNHLDLPSIERLQAALVDWPGALLLVTHDEGLARACCGARWRLPPGE